MDSPIKDKPVRQKIVISERDNLAALLENDQVCEFIIHRGDILLGDVYLAQVENILPSIDAAFVNVGTDRMGFLHSSDVQGRGDLKNRLQPKQRLVVQVIKEPTGHKGPRVTTNIAMPGRFLVFLPDSKGVSISRKILNPKERSRLKSILSLIKPPGVGVIIRTEAEEQTDAEIQDDFETLLERWQNIVALADTTAPPALLHRDQDLLYRVIRELVSEDTSEIIVDSQFGQQRAQQLLQNWGIQHAIKVTQYEGNQNILVGTGVEKEIRNALQTRVPLPSGGYIYVQTTEALTVVDVNSGKFTSLESQEATILHTNMEAAKEIARQLRLRNIGGMIVVDFIDMLSRANQLKVLQAFEEMMDKDKGKPQVGQLSDLGLVEMTRHRQGQSLSEIFAKKCLTCNGSAHVVDDFHWAPASSAGDYNRFGQQRFNRPQSGGRPQQRGGNNNATTSNAPNGSPQQNRGGQQQGQQQGRDNRNAGKTLQKYLSPQKDAASQLRQDFLQQPEVAKTHDEKELIKTGALEDVFKFWLHRHFGINFASCAKVGILPIEVNGIISRMCAKSTDVFALVQAIESAGGQELPSDDDDDDDMTDDDDMNSDNNDTNASDSSNNDDDSNDTTEEIPEEVEEVIEVMNDPDEDEDPRFSMYDADEPDNDSDTDGESNNDSEAPVLTSNKKQAVAVMEPEEGKVVQDESSDDTTASAAPKRRGRPPAKNRNRK